MAFTDSELVTLGDITGYDPVALSDWLDGITLSDEAEAAIQADIEYWDDNLAYAAGVSIAPKEANFGATINGDELRNAIIRRTRTRLQMPSSVYSSSIGTLQIGL
jgi:hypothetical protein